MSTSTRATGRKHPRTFDVNKKLPPTVLHAIAQDLSQGAVAVFPTETVYGIGTSAFSSAGIRRIYSLKGRRWNKPLALLLPSLEAAAPLVEEIPEEAYRLASEFWPGPLTLVLRASPLGRLVTGGLERIGLRVPDHPVILKLLETLGVPLASSSANRSGEPPAVSSSKARAFAARVEWFLDGGRCPLREASSVVDLTHFPFTVIRDGATPKAALMDALHSGDR